MALRIPTCLAGMYSRGERFASEGTREGCPYHRLMCCDALSMEEAFPRVAEMSGGHLPLPLRKSGKKKHPLAKVPPAGAFSYLTVLLFYKLV